MPILTPRPALTKTQQEILELLKVPGEVIEPLRRLKYRLRKSGKIFTYETFNPIRNQVKKIVDPEFDKMSVWCYYSPEEKAKDLAKYNESERECARLAAERLADRNRRWRAAVLKCFVDLHCGDLDETALAAVFDAIASEASMGDVPEVLRR